MTGTISKREQEPVDDVRSYFERAAGSFDRLYSAEKQTPFWRWLNRRFRSDIVGRYLRTCRHITEVQAQSVLDVGCGSGRYLAAFAELGVKRMVGIDLSQPMLDLASKHLGEIGRGDVTLVRCDFQQFDTAERFDVVVAMGFFDYQADPVAVLKKMRSLARHSVIASFPRKHWFRTPLRRFRYWLKRCPVYFYDRERVTKLSEEAGFVSIEATRLSGAGMDIVAVMRVGN